MTLTIELSPSEEIRLAAAAQREGIDLAQMAHKLVAEHLPTLATHDEDPVAALFTRWEDEDAALTPEELREEQRQWEEMKTHLNAERDRAGARRVF
jgi:hypothetical protein